MDNRLLKIFCVIAVIATLCVIAVPHSDIDQNKITVAKPVQYYIDSTNIAVDEMKMVLKKYFKCDSIVIEDYTHVYDVEACLFFAISNGDTISSLALYDSESKSILTVWGSDTLSNKQ